ncbi:hypothetical protein N825_36965 [Skermanella stibiiresistens SB22]|uniref:Uncharacterized protein n=1 Tax=Skermanella stibiiresistens SB22 TaxID=1385369 RepID=W9H9A2_9PROT|nr:hypothetical protein [Skermanella stibiiresistens]EWY40398.1 hypothetical protein N825_36965 [Skermanella stibiiresistens SB22]
MPHLDRDSFIALLDRLGDPDETEALASAREIDRRVRASGMGWNDLLVPPPGTSVGALDDDYHGTFTDDDPLYVAPRRRANGYADDMVLIDGLLADETLGETTRQELMDLKNDIAEGEFTDMDSKYLRDLHARLTPRHTASTPSTVGTMSETRSNSATDA